MRGGRRFLEVGNGAMYSVVGRTMLLTQELTSQFPEALTILSYTDNETADVIMDHGTGRRPCMIRVGPM